MQKKYFFSILIWMGLMCYNINLDAQQKSTVELIAHPKEKKVTVFIAGEKFTEFIYPDSIEKPVLFPVYAPNGAPVTRGFPILSRPGEPTDHPHHKGLWFNYENVNGLDFWNNSYAIPAGKKNGYGWIKTDQIVEVKSGKEGRLVYTANWVNQQNQALLRETTTFIFSADANQRIIDRITALEAMQDVTFADAKDGLLGLRVAHELELPSAQPRTFADAKGNITNVAAAQTATGNYITSEGKEGDSAWSTRGRWCMLYGKIKGDTISIAIFDHPKNPGYPTYWHARGYGLFAANPLGAKIFSNGRHTMNFILRKGEKTSFRYRIVIASGAQRLSNEQLTLLSTGFEKEIDK